MLPTKHLGLVGLEVPTQRLTAAQDLIGYMVEPKNGPQGSSVMRFIVGIAFQ